MSALSITSISFDKPVYAQGDTIRATIAYTGAAFTLHAVANVLGHNGVLDGSFTVLPAWTVTDDGGRTWTLVSDDGSTAVVTATA